MKNLGMIGIINSHSAYLQAHKDDGEMHASNTSRNEEETWFLIEVDEAQHKYAFLNWDSGKYISAKGTGCVPADSTILGEPECWILQSGAPFQLYNAVALKNAADGCYLGAYPPGKNDPGGCGGEVASREGTAPKGGVDKFGGWWVFQGCTAPTPGKDLWNTIGGVFQGMVNAINPVDVVALLGFLAYESNAISAAETANLLELVAEPLPNILVHGEPRQESAAYS